MVLAVALSSCVHDDKYNTPNLEGYGCIDESFFTNNTAYTKLTIADALALPQNATITDNVYIEGYVSSSDETGNVYKYIYIQDAPENPTRGLTISVNSVNNYTNYPQGSKIFVDLKGLAIGTYGSVRQLGAMENGVYGRIPESAVATNILRSCTGKEVIVPKVMKLSEMVSANDQYIGCLIKVENAEFDDKVLCTTFAPSGVTVDKAIRDTSTSTSRIVRNSGYASFANQMLPAGNGDFVGIYSKFNTTYQMYINRVSDLKMTSFPRKTGALLATDPCAFDASTLTQKTVAQVKQYYTGGTTWTQIPDNAYLKAQVVANDESGNLYKYLYVEDATGGIRVGINKTNIYQDARLALGKTVNIKLKDLYVHNVSGEIQLGTLYNGGTQFGGIEEADMFKYFFNSNLPASAVTAKELTIPQLSTADVGRWIKIKNVEFIDGDVGKSYADGTSNTNRTLKDCNGNTVILRTSGYADFATNEVKGGKGDISGVLTVFNGVYQLWITKVGDAILTGTRCDGSSPRVTIFKDGFDNLNNWTAVNVTGTQVWNIQQYGNPKPCVVMNGNSASVNYANEDWLVSKAISLNGYSEAYVSFETDGRYPGDPLKFYVTENYTGDPATTTWVELPALLDTNLTSFGAWVSSGSLNVSSYVNKNVVFAFKYTSTTSAASTWEVDNFKVSAR